MDHCDVIGIWHSALKSNVLSNLHRWVGKKTSVVQVFSVLLEIRGFQMYCKIANITILPSFPLPLSLLRNVLRKNHISKDIPNHLTSIRNDF